MGKTIPLLQTTRKDQAHKRMNNRKALSLAIKVIEARIKFIAFNANGFDVMGMDSPAMVRASKERKDLKEVVDVLERMRKDTGFY